MVEFRPPVSPLSVTAAAEPRELQDTPTTRAWLETQSIPKCGEWRYLSANRTDTRFPAPYCPSAYCVRCGGLRALNGVAPIVPNGWLAVATGQPAESDPNKIISYTHPRTLPTADSDFTVKPELTNKPKRVRDHAKDFRGFARRIVRAYGVRAGDDIEALADLAALSADVDTAIATAVTTLRTAGHSWADIGARLGVSRQAAQQRWKGNS